MIEEYKEKLKQFNIFIRIEKMIISKDEDVIVITTIKKYFESEKECFSYNYCDNMKEVELYLKGLLKGCELNKRFWRNK